MSTASDPVVRLKNKVTHRCLGGHPWIFSSEIEMAGTEKLTAERAVRVLDSRGRLVGTGLWSPRSQIRIRLFSFGEERWDAALIRERLAKAAARRPAAECRRLCWSEADGLPGLVVDQYGSYLCVQVLHAGIEACRAEIFEALQELFSPQGIIERSDAPVRQREGLPSRNGVVRGEYLPPSQHTFGDVLGEVDLLGDQKTGAYLDQTANQRRVASLVSGGAFLDVFANSGGFGLHAARRGCVVEAVESGVEAVARGTHNAALNKVEMRWHTENAFDWLRAASDAGRHFKAIVLDPPSFARSRDRLEGALRGYKEIHVRALRMLSPGGLLATYCCSHLVPIQAFEETVLQAAADAGVRLRLIERHGQPADHPVLFNMPESEYLKGLLLELE